MNKWDELTFNKSKSNRFEKAIKKTKGWYAKEIRDIILSTDKELEILFIDVMNYYKNNNKGVNL